MSEIIPSSTISGDGQVGVYVHVPFCASTCDYCGFYQEAPTAGSIGQYLAGIDAEAGLVGLLPRVDTVFWGGGTPGLLSAADLARLGQKLQRLFSRVPTEWTIELAPGSVTEARLEVLKDLGVTRISMGVQSFQPELLEKLGRRHSREQVYRAFERIRAAEFHSVNLDLMFALPGQDDDTWLADLHEALVLAPDHLSTYCLTFEEDTAMWVKLSKGQFKLDRDKEARLYEKTWELLEAAGYAQYEISNFARSGFACLHNLNTWRMQQWVGLGPSAASQFAGWRGTNVPDLAKWIERLGQGQRAIEDRQEVTPSLLAEDSLVFGLRMNEGVDLDPVKMSAPTAVWTNVDALVQRLVAEGLAKKEGPRVRLTLAGRLLADAIGVEVMEAFSASVTI